MATTGGADWAEQYYLVSDSGVGLRVLYLFFVAFFTIVAWNIVMSSFVEKACRLAMPDLEATAMEKHREQSAYAKELSKLLLSKIDTNGDGILTIDEFRQHLQDPEVVTFFLARDINVTDAEMFFHMLASIHGTDSVKVKTFTSAILRLRGTASAIDMQSCHFDIKNVHGESNSRLCRLEEMVARLELRQLDQPAFSEYQRCRLEELLSRLQVLGSPAVDTDFSDGAQWPSASTTCASPRREEGASVCAKAESRGGGSKPPSPRFPNPRSSPRGSIQL
jgi:hypothetical protein